MNMAPIRSVLLEHPALHRGIRLQRQPDHHAAEGMASDRMPLSMQLVGPHLSEDVLARAAHAFQSVTDWHTQRPPV